jgi:pyridoxine kinase
MDLVADFIATRPNTDQLVVIDPVMGDNGATYGPISAEMVNQMREYVRLADIITPNLTEAAFLLDEPYRQNINEHEVREWMLRLSEMGPRTIIVTSVPDPGSRKRTSVLAYDRADGRFWKVGCDYIPANYPGTGDAFASVVVGSILQGDSLPIALDRAVQFVSIAIRATFGHTHPAREGVLLERVLDNLKGPVVLSSYELME